MKTALYAGSFDPFTNGHLHVIETTSKLFDRVVVDIGVNDSKKRHYDVDLMKRAMEEVFASVGLDNVDVVIYDGLTVDLAINENVDILIRGIRDSIDLANEESIADFNYDISSIDTLYIRAGIAGSISSSKVREMIKYDKPIDKYVPGPIKKLVYNEK